ncbi:MAG: hypothetical protein LUC33_05090, partial [Prevotellaceae bacterium]|nr:hypothetical protein [Prevotellaceae bacterium]
HNQKKTSDMTDKERLIIRKTAEKLGLEASIGAENEPVVVFIRKAGEGEDEASMLLAVYPKEFTLPSLAKGLDGFVHNRKDCECLFNMTAPLPSYLGWARRTVTGLSRRLAHVVRREGGE